jgi:hypothetical protein
MIVYKTDFVSQISALIHYRESFPLACFHVDLLNIGREATAEAASKYNNFVRLRTKACAITQGKFKLYFQTLPVTILRTVALNCVKTVLAIISTKSKNELVVDYCSRESAFANIHRLEIAPLIFFDIIDFTTIQKNILNSIVSTHNIHEIVTNHCSMLFSHLVH